MENFTGLGLQDIAARAIRTLLPPKETFTDDLLWVIRLICFASHLDFTIVPEGKGAIKLPEIKEHNPSSVQTQIITHTQLTRPPCSVGPENQNLPGALRQ